MGIFQRKRPPNIEDYLPVTPPEERQVTVDEPVIMTPFAAESAEAISTGRHTQEYLEASDPLVVFLLDYWDHSCKLPSPFVDECKKLAFAMYAAFEVKEK